MKTIPFVPIPVEKAKKVSKKFYWLSDKLKFLYPSLSANLVRAGIELSPREYIGIALFSAVFWFFLIFSVFLPIQMAFRSANFYLSITLAFFISFMSFFYILSYPKLLLSRKLRNIEKNMLFAIRHLYIQVRSGVSLFDAMVSVSKGNYGLISKEFEKCVKEIATGKDEIEALEDLSFRNPSPYFRRTVWQIINSLKAGGNVGETLRIIAENLSEEQKVKIRKYGSQLSPLALMYLMLTVVFPTLGTTFLLVFATFTGISVSHLVFYLILAVLAIFQFMFIGLIKNRRPSVEV